jgi:hypothetical protein
MIVCNYTIQITNTLKFKKLRKQGNQEERCRWENGNIVGQIS